MRHARKQASKSRSRRKLPQLSQVSQLSQLQLRSMARGGLDPWCCRLVVPSPAINCPVRSGSQGLGLVFLCRWCAVYRVVWPEIRSSQRFAVWVCGCPRSRVAQATASKRWMVASVEESRHGPCSVYFPQLCSCAAGLLGCIRPWPFIFICNWRQQTTSRKWCGARSICRGPPPSDSLLLCRQGPPNEPNEPKQGHPEAQSRPSRAPFAGPSRCSFVPSVLHPVYTPKRPKDPGTDSPSREAPCGRPGPPVGLHATWSPQLWHSILTTGQRCHGDGLDHTEHFLSAPSSHHASPKAKQKKAPKTGWPTSSAVASGRGWRCTTRPASNPAPFLSSSALTGPLPQRMAASMGRTLDVTSESVAPALPSAVWGDGGGGTIPCSSDPGPDQPDQPPCFASQAANLSRLCQACS